MSKTVVGLMDNRPEAEAVVRELVESGFDRDAIGIIANDSPRRLDEPRHTYGDDAEADTGAGALTGMGAGAAVGGIGGLLAGLAGLAIPGIGPVIAAGPIAAALAGAGAGAVAGTIIGALANLGIPKEEAGYYAEGIRRGGVLVTVNAVDDDDAERAADIMRVHGAADIDERVARWRETGWTGFDETAAPYSPDTDLSRREMPAREPVVSERRVRVYSSITTGSPGAEPSSFREQAGLKGRYTGPERRRGPSSTYTGVERRAAA
jgi:hypothetical protein